MLFETRRHRDRRRRLEAGFPPAWRDLLADRFGHWARLDEGERARLEGLALAFVVEKDWEAAHGFELTEEITVLIAAQAGLLLLGLPDDALRGVHAIVVHPSTVVLHGPRSQVPGVVSDDPMAILGQAVDHGPVVVAWDAASDEASHPGHGHNVVVHELAHKLDMLDGAADGVPPLPTAAQRERWVEVCTTVYEQVVEGRGGSSLRPYAGVNPAEFFAVATEALFEAPLTLHAEHPSLYAVLAAYYGQDPAARLTRRPGGAAPATSG